MNGPNYYNEFDPYVAGWLRNLIAAGHIAPGVVDERDIRDIEPAELMGYTQCHFFAGIGGWSRALRLAGWPDGRRIWTGSCPCQPFSAAGRGVGFADERHLWPAWFHLITQCRPDEIRGEQVASLDAIAWLDLVQTDLEAAGYAFAAVDLCAAGIGAPHIRQRLGFVAHAAAQRRLWRWASKASYGRDAPRFESERLCDAGGVADADGWNAGTERQQRGRQQRQQSKDRSADRMADTDLARFCGEQGLRIRGADFHDADGRSPVSGFWADADWIPCRDGKWRPVEPGTFPLAHGIPNRVGRLRAYGNAIVPQVFAEFIRASDGGAL